MSEFEGYLFIFLLNCGAAFLIYKLVRFLNKKFKD